MNLETSKNIKTVANQPPLSTQLPPYKAPSPHFFPPIDTSRPCALHSLGPRLQTDPFTPDYYVEDGRNPEVLAISMPL